MQVSEYHVANTGRNDDPAFQRWLLIYGDRDQILDWLNWNNNGNGVWLDVQSSAAGMPPAEEDFARGAMRDVLCEDPVFCRADRQMVSVQNGATVTSDVVAKALGEVAADARRGVKRGTLSEDIGLLDVVAVLENVAGWIERLARETAAPSQG